MYPAIRRRHDRRIFQHGTLKIETGECPRLLCNTKENCWKNISTIKVEAGFDLFSMQHEGICRKNNLSTYLVPKKRTLCSVLFFYYVYIILKLICISHKFLIHSIIQEHKKNLHQQVNSPETHSHVSHNGMAKFIE